MGRSLRRQVEHLHATFSELVRRYQFRDREGICCHGISVSQCHVLEALDATESLTMGELARRLYVEVSTMTRIVDQLVAKKLVRRTQDTKDRRVWFVRITASGRSLITEIRERLLQEHEEVLRKVPVQSREDVIQAVEGLLAAFQARTETPGDQRRGAS